MQVLSPHYQSADGTVAESPLDVAGSEPTVDLVALACLFTSPGIYGEFAPASYWSGVQLKAPGPFDRSSSDLGEAFEAAVADLCGDAETVGIKLSGGLDSLAVLTSVAQLRPRRRVVAYCANLIDDEGTHASDITRRLLGCLDSDIALVIVDPAQCAATPPWSPVGPRLDALPYVNAGIAELAANDGVEILLSGDGADELLAVSRYATWSIARNSGTRAAYRYLADIRHSEPGLAGEAVALIGDQLPAALRMRWYWAASWPEWCNPAVSPVLAAAYKDHAQRWANRWVDDTIASHTANDRTWTQADAYDAFWPHTPIQAAGNIPEASPFLHEAVLSVSLPPHARYDPSLPTAYQRCKSAIVGLMPSRVHPVLPHRKSYYTRALLAAHDSALEVHVAAMVGLLDPDAIARETELAVLINARAVEDWLAGALELGFTISGSI